MLEHLFCRLFKQKVKVGGNQTNLLIFAIEPQKLAVKWCRFQAFAGKRSFCEVMDFYTIIVQSTEELIEIFAAILRFDGVLCDYLS